MRIAQVSDFHFTRLTWNPFRLISKRILGHFNWIFSRTHSFSEEIVLELPDLFRKLEVDYVILGGDFTTTALKEEFLVAREFVERLKMPWLAIPGNHDVYTYRSQREKAFYRFLRSTGMGEKFEGVSLEKDRLEAHRLRNGYWLVALDVCRATNLYSSRGLFSEGLEKKLRNMLSVIPLEESIVVACHYPFFKNDAFRRTLKRGEALKKILEEEKRICLYLHGHTHRHTVADLQPSGLPVVLDSGSAAEKKHASWNLIELKKDGCTVTPYQYKEGWTPLARKDIEWKR